MAVDLDTKRYLDEVKKGKPRRFVMVCKGVKILSMFVFKKGTIEKFKKQAKQEGKGQFYHGVVDGKGANICFKLSRVDGFEKPPGKELILKDFLSTEAGMKFKPTYEIVDTLPTISEGEEDEAALETPPDAPPTAVDEPEGAGSEAQERSAETGAAPDVLATKLAEALTRLKPLVSKATSAHPERKGELLATLGQIAGEIKAKQFEPAKQNIAEFAELLKSLAAAQAAPNGAEAQAQRSEFATRREALEARLLEAQAADEKKAPQLGAVWNYASEQAEAGHFENAFQALDKVQVAIDAVLQAAGGAARSGDSQGFAEQWGLATGRWRDASDEVDSQISQLQQALRQTDDTELHEIAEFGLNGITAGAKVKLMAAIQDVNAAGPAVPAGTIDSARQAVTAFRDQIESDERVAVCDENPFGVAMSIRDTFGPALTALEAALGSSPS